MYINYLEILNVRTRAKYDDKSLLRVHLPNELFMRLWLLWISPKLSFYSRALKGSELADRVCEKVQVNFTCNKRCETRKFGTTLL